MPAQPQAGVIDASFPMWCEFGSKKAAAIPAHMARCRALAYTGIALRAAPAQLNRTGLAFSNPPLAETKFSPRLHRASLYATPEFRLSLLLLPK